MRESRECLFYFAWRVRPGLNAVQIRSGAKNKATLRQFSKCMRLLHEIYRIASSPTKGESKTEVPIDSCSCVWNVFHVHLKRSCRRTQHPGSRRAGHRI